MRMRMTMKRVAMIRIIIINIFRKHGRVKREIKRSPSSKSGRDTSGNRRCAQQDQGDLRLLKERIYSFLSRSDDKEGVWGADGEPGGAAHQDHHGQLHHCHLWGNGDCSVFSIFSRFFPMVAMILHLFFLLLTITCTCRWVGWQILQSLLWGTLTMACSEYLKFSGTFFFI